MNWKQRLVGAPAGYAPAIGRWVWALEDTRQRTIESLAGMSEVVDWIPPEGDNSAGTLLYHIVAIEMSYLYQDILEKGWSAELEPLLIYDVRDDGGKVTAVLGESLEQHLQRLEAGRALLLSALKEMTPDDFRRSRLVEDYAVTPEWVLHHLMQHEAEHRGQIAEIGRLAVAAGLLPADN